jgi:hypothetical protein
MRVMVITVFLPVFGSLKLPKMFLAYNPNFAILFSEELLIDPNEWAEI